MQIIFKHTYRIEPLKVLLMLRVDLGVMVVNVNLTLLKAPQLESYNQFQFSVILETPHFGVGAYPSAVYADSVFQALSTGWGYIWERTASPNIKRDVSKKLRPMKSSAGTSMLNAKESILKKISVSTIVNLCFW